MLRLKGAAVKLATELRKSKEYIRQMKEETLERLRVCLTAPWLSDFRVQALGEEIEKLPDVTYISWHAHHAGKC
jgi:predicted phage tail protein